MLMQHTQLTGIAQMIRRLMTQNLQGTLHASARRNSRLSATAQVRIIKIRQTVRGRTNLLAGTRLTPRGQGAGRAHTLQQLRNRLAVTHHHTVGAAHLACLRNNVQATSRTHQRERRLRTGTGNLQGRGTTRLSQRTVRQKRTAHDRLGVLQGAVHHSRRQATHRAATQIQQTGLASQRLTAVIHTHNVAAASTQATTADAGQLRVVTVNLRDGAAHAVGGCLVVDLRLHHDSPRDNVQASGKTQNRRDFCLTSRDFRCLVVGEFVLDERG